MSTSLGFWQDMTGDFRGRPSILISRLIYGKQKKVLHLSHLRHTCLFSITQTNARWTDNKIDWTYFITYFLGRTSLTSVWPFHSPASLHSSSHLGNRRPVPGQIRSWKDSSLRSYHTSASRACCRRMFRFSDVSHARAGISNQK